VRLAIAAIESHPGVLGVALAGSCSRGARALSDWDFAVETAGSAAVARDLPDLVVPLERPARTTYRAKSWSRLSLLLRAKVSSSSLVLKPLRADTQIRPEGW
jgi:predicted nucleotidyltransferase